LIALIGTFKNFIRAECGAFTAIFAVMAPVLIAGAGLAVDVSFWYSSKRDLQNAADAGALAGGYELLRTESQAFATDEASRVAQKNVDGPSQVTTVFPRFDRIQVTVQATSQTFFLGHFVSSPPVITATALAELDQTEPKPPACLNLLDPDGQGLRINGNGRVEMGDNCGVQVNSGDKDAIFINGESRLLSDDVCVHGAVVAQSPYAISSVPKLNCPQIKNPYAHLEEPLSYLGRDCPGKPRDIIGDSVTVITNGNDQSSKGGDYTQIKPTTGDQPAVSTTEVTAGSVQSIGGGVSANVNVGGQIVSGDPVSGGGGTIASGNGATPAGGGTISNNGSDQVSGNNQQTVNGNGQASNNNGQSSSSNGRGSNNGQSSNGNSQSSGSSGTRTINSFTVGAESFGTELRIQRGVTVDLVGPNPVVMCFDLVVNSKATLNIRSHLIFTNGASLIVRGRGKVEVFPPKEEVPPFQGLSIISSEENNGEHDFAGGARIKVNGGRGISVPGDRIVITGNSNIVSTSSSITAKSLKVGGNTTVGIGPNPPEQPLPLRGGEFDGVRLID